MKWIILLKITLRSAREIIEILASFGFKPVHQTGSHIHLLHPRLVTVPRHMEIATDTLISILKQANIEKEDFFTARDVIAYGFGNCHTMKHRMPGDHCEKIRSYRHVYVFF